METETALRKYVEYCRSLRLPDALIRSVIVDLLDELLDKTPESGTITVE
jgi:hypothetical protein